MTSVLEQLNLFNLSIYIFLVILVVKTYGAHNKLISIEIIDIFIGV